MIYESHLPKDDDARHCINMLIRAAASPGDQWKYKTRWDHACDQYRRMSRKDRDLFVEWIVKINHPVARMAMLPIDRFATVAIDVKVTLGIEPSWTTANLCERSTDEG